MITQKRNKIRKQLRSQQLNRKFAIKRKSLLDGRISIFKELYNEIRACSHQTNLQFELNIKLLNTAQHYDQEQDTYILIGNYLIDHPEAYCYFQEFIMSSGRFLQNYLWCLHMLVNCYGEKIKMQGMSRCDLSAKLQSILYIMDEMRQDMSMRINQRQHYSKVKKMQMEYLLVMHRLTSIPFISNQALQPIKYSLQIIKSIQPACYQTQQLYHFYQFFYALKQHWEFIEQHHLCAPYAIAFQKILLPCLKNMPQIRLQCVKLLHFLLRYQNETFFMSHIYSQQMLMELIYLLEQIPSLKTQILGLLKSILHEININDLSSILSLRIHIILTKGIQQSMMSKSNEELQICLAGIVNLLTRLKYLQEEKLLRTVLRDIENVDFHLMIEGLVNNQQNEIIANLVNTVIDDYYSEQTI